MSWRTLTAAGALCVLTLTGCTGSGDASQQSAGTPSPSPVDLQQLDTDAMVIAREPFCGRLAPGTPARALGAEVDDVTEYGPGDTVEVVQGVTDVADEWSCSYGSADDITARAWLFAPPVTRARAQTLVEGARAEECTPAGVSFGTPSIGLVCEGESGTTASWRGLFGDAWLACSLRSPAGSTTTVAELRARASLWCADVATAASP